MSTSSNLLESLFDFQSLIHSFDEAGLSISVADITQNDMPLVYVNQAFTDLTGYSLEEVKGQNCRFLQNGQTPLSSLNIIHNALETLTPCNVTLINFKKSGERFTNRLTLLPIQQPEGVQYFMGIQREVHNYDDELVNALAESNENLMTLIEHMSEGVIIHSKSGPVVHANPAAQEILGLNLKQLKGLTSLDPRWASIYEDGSPYPGSEHPVMRVIRNKETIIGDIMGVRHANGSLRWLSINATALQRQKEDDSFILVTFSDITLQKSLSFAAMKDELSKLYNRRFFNNDFNSLLMTEPQPGKQWYFAMYDIDYFKEFNDNYGHIKGDEVIKSIGRVLMQSMTEPYNYNFRLGGEEFASLIQAKNIEDAKNQLIEVQNLIALECPKHKSSPFNKVTVSIGLFKCKQKEKIRYHYQKADEALYQAKTNGKNKICIIE